MVDDGEEPTRDPSGAGPGEGDVSHPAAPRGWLRRIRDRLGDVGGPDLEERIRELI